MIAGPVFFTGKFEILKFNGIAFNEEMKRRSKLLMRQAAIAFLNAATERIPMRTSFARGGFDNLATALGVAGRSGPRNTIPRGPEYYYISKGIRVLKTREAGRNFSSEANIERILQTAFPSKLGSAIRFFKTSIPSITFEYNVQIDYLSVNESKWGALRAGRDAFVLFLSTNAKSVIPNLKDFTTTELLNIPGVPNG